jgi:hypothetical protein
MRIEVTSREETPSGKDPGVEVRAFRIPLKKGRGPNSTRVDILDVAPKVVVDEAPDTAAGPSALPRAHIQMLNVLSTNLDPVDLGAPARRVVHAHVVEQHPL